MPWSGMPVSGNHGGTLSGDMLLSVEVVLRSARNEDEEFLYRLHRESMRSVVEATWGFWGEAEQRAWHSEWFVPARLSIIVVDGEDAGVLDTEVRADGVLYLRRLEIVPGLQNRGIGQRVVQELIEGTADQGAPAIELDVLAANAGAQRFYVGHGFLVIGYSEPKYRMRLDLP